ncbi:MAG: AI-2E family transporter, partial [Actinobacteria bacterium]|nr:AI-2E family transporter [Actinomycetota bacterium]
MLFDKKPYTFDSVVRLGITVALIYGFIWALGYLSDVLVPFAVALLLAYLINPLVTWVQKKIHSRVAAVLLTLLFLIVLLSLLVWILVPLIVNEISNMGRMLSKVVSESDLADSASKRLPPDLWQAIKDYAANKDVQQFFSNESFVKITEAVFRKLLPGMWGIITGTASFIIGIIGLAVIVLYLVFLLIDFHKVRADWIDLIPPLYRQSVLDFIHDFNTAMKRHFRAQAAIASIVGVLFAIGFAIINLPMGILFGLFVGLLNMIPYLQILSIPLAILLALMHALETGTGFWMNIGLVAIVYVVVQEFQDWFLVPKIQGKTTGMSPAMILLSLSIWGKLLGLLGLLIALPMTFLILAYY